MRGMVFENIIHPEIKLSTILKLKYFLNLHIYDVKNYSILNNKIQCRANTGFSAIFDLLENEAKEIFITGFSFYLDSFVKGYKKGFSVKKYLQMNVLIQKDIIKKINGVSLKVIRIIPNLFSILY